MSATAQLFAALDAISQPEDRRELKRRVLAIRAQSQELFEWLSDARLEDARN